MLKDLPESIEYRQYLIDESKRNIQIATIQEMENKTLKERVSILEERIDKQTTILENINLLLRRR